MNKGLRITFVTALLLMPTMGFAKENTLASIQRNFQEKFKNTTFSEIRESEISGLYEVVMGENIAYTDATGRYFILGGHLFDMDSQTDLTESRKSERKIGSSKKTDFPSMFLDNAIKTVKGDGSRKIAVFTDPDCPYGRRLEVELTKINNVTIYTFLFPLESLHPEAKSKAVSIWCSQDKAKAWTKFMKTGEMPMLIACANPVNENIVLGSRLGVTGTPTLIAEDGSLLPGAAPAETIEQWLGTVK